MVKLSKIHNLLYITGVTANSLHPGLVNTEILTKNKPGTILHIIQSLLWMMGKVSDCDMHSIF